MSLKWSKDHSVYLPEIDAEHRSLYRISSELQKAVVGGAKPAQLRSILAHLLEAGEEHFRHEERLMKVVHYSAFAWHKAQHDHLRKRLRATIKQVDGGDPEACRELLKMLDTWLANHMAVTDRMMGAFIRNYLRFNTALAS